MARVIYTAAALHDLEQPLEFLLEHDRSAAAETAGLITDAVEMLAKHPLLGRATSERLRELVISRGVSGHLALYDYDAARELIVILGVRHQREAGHSDPADPE